MDSFLVKEKVDSVVKAMRMPVSPIDLFYFCDLLRSTLSFGMWTYVNVNPNVDKYTVDLTVYEFVPKVSVVYSTTLRFGNSITSDSTETNVVKRDKLPNKTQTVNTKSKPRRKPRNVSDVISELLRLKLSNKYESARTLISRYDICDDDMSTPKWEKFIKGMTAWDKDGRVRYPTNCKKTLKAHLITSGFLTA